MHARAEEPAVAVVEIDDGTVAGIPQDSRSDHARRRELPIVCKRNRPHHGRVPQLAHFAEHEPVAAAKRRSHDPSVNSGSIEDCPIGAFEGPAKAALAVEHQVLVTPGVIANRVAVVHFTPHDIRIGRNRAAHDEERRVNSLRVQNREQLAGVRWIRPVVIGERYDALILRTADQRLAEELAARALYNFITFVGDRS